jgi:pilus biogenesis lipoprotein CpaD
MMLKTLPCMMLLALGACSSTMDLQGLDPVDYYAQNPKKNKVDTRTETVTVYVAPAVGGRSGAAENALQKQMPRVSMAAVDSIQVELSPHDMKDTKRRAYIAKLLRHLGYDKGDVMFEPSDSVRNLHANITMIYAVVVSPDCPDWKRSPNNTHSNTRQGNFECANEVNIGLMVEDPRDLEQGAGAVRMDTTRAARAIQTYREGDAAASSSAPSLGASIGDAAAAVVPQ